MKLYKSSFKKNRILFSIALLVFVFNAYAFADVEIIQYNYDSTRQIKDVIYDNETEINYIYDTSGNRLFRTVSLSGTPVNNPPNAPSDPYPADSEDKIDLEDELLWTRSSDPDTGDVISYDIYFGVSPSPPLIKSGHENPNYAVSLKPLTTYYWKIVARDNHNATAEGPVWNFETMNFALNADFTVTPNSGPAPLSVNFIDSIDSLMSYNQPLRYEWDFDNGGITDSIEKNPSYIYSNQGLYTVKLTVIDSLGEMDSLTKSNYISVAPPIYNMTVIKSGSGNGTVKSDPSGIECGIDCIEAFQGITEVTLNAIPDAGSTFTGWSGEGCYGTGDCIVAMNTDKNIIAAFDTCSNPPVRIVNKTDHSRLQDAYNVADEGDVIQSQAARFIDNLNINRTILVFMEGGFNCNYTSKTGNTILKGQITISNGTLNAKDFILEK